MQLEENFQRVIEVVEKGQEYDFTGKISQIKEELKRVQKSINEEEVKRNVLRLGIIGQMKVGKSSFLNALFFDGKEYLPKAATPMTAALTVLKYNAVPSASVYYLTKKDWDDGICMYAKQYDAHVQASYDRYLKEKKEIEKNTNAPVNILPFEEYEKNVRNKMSDVEVSCKEVYEMARKRLSDKEIQEILIKGRNDVPLGNEYMDSLEQYVGANGKYTPLVKYTEISLNIEELKGIEIIDTPGLNDPIRSRENATREFLGKCDAVFILSNCGKFLGEEEMDLILNTLPDEGISEAVIVGTRMDTAICESPGNIITFEQAYRKTRENCEKQAEENLRQYKDLNIVNKLIGVKPVLTSSISYNIAIKRKKGEKLNEEEQQCVDSLSSYQGFNEDMLMDLSSIMDIKEDKLNSIRKEKNKIIDQKQLDIRIAARERVIRYLDSIINQTNEVYSTVRNNDINTIRLKLEAAQNTLENSKSVVASIFKATELSVKRDMQELLLHIRNEKQRHRNVYMNSKMEEKTSEYSVPKKFLFVEWEKKKTRTEHVMISTVSVRDARINIEKYLNDSYQIIQEDMKNLINTEEIEKKLIMAIKDSYDLSDKDFNEKSILEPIKNHIEEMTLHEFEWKKDKDYIALLEEKLTGKIVGDIVKDEKISILQKAMDEVLLQVMDDLCDSIEDHRDEIAKKMDKESEDFINDICENLEESHTKLKKLIEDGENSLVRIESYLCNLKEIKQEIIEAE